MKKVLSSRLRDLRGALSQTEFARKIGVKQTSYSGWESGAKVPAATVAAHYDHSSRLAELLRAVNSAG